MVLGSPLLFSRLRLSFFKGCRQLKKGRFSGRFIGNTASEPSEYGSQFLFEDCTATIFYQFIPSFF
jgi:hypothetical protein